MSSVGVIDCAKNAIYQRNLNINLYWHETREFQLWMRLCGQVVKAVDCGVRGHGSRGGRIDFLPRKMPYPANLGN